MRLPGTWYSLALIWMIASPVSGQMIHCINPPSAAPAESACRITVDPVSAEQHLVLQLRAPNGTPIPDRMVTFEATSGLIKNADTTNTSGYVEVNWIGSVENEPVTITASSSHNGMTMRRQIRLARREPPADPPYIENLAPTGGHSSYAKKYLTDPIEVQIEADPVTCNKTVVVVEYLSAGSETNPKRVTEEIPALFTQLDPNRFECAAQFKWHLSGAVGEQEMRVWIKRDTLFVPPENPDGPQRYLRPRVVHAVAHPLPAFMIGAAIVDESDSTRVPRVVGVDLSFPNVADFLKHNVSQGAGKFVDHIRLFLGTNFSTDDEDIGDNVYVGIEPVVLLVGPRIADLPVAFSVGRRMGEDDDLWFAAALINAASAVQTVLKALGIQ